MPNKTLQVEFDFSDSIKKNKKKQFLPINYSESYGKVPNNFIRAYYKCSTTAQKLFSMSIVEYLKQKEDNTSNWISFSLADFRTALSIKDGSKTREVIKNAVDEVLKLSLTLQDDDLAYHKLNVFEEMRSDFEEGQLKFKYSSKMSTFINELKQIGYTIFGLQDIGKIKSFYAIRYYLIALSFQGFKGSIKDKPNSWFFDYTVQGLRDLFEIKPTEYERTDSFTLKVVKQPINEVNSLNLGVSIEIETIRKGHKIEGFRFWCTEKAAQLKIEKDDPQNIKEFKKEINQTKKDIQYYKEKYPEEYNNAFLEATQQGEQGLAIFGPLAEAKAIEILKSKGFN